MLPLFAEFGFIAPRSVARLQIMHNSLFVLEKYAVVFFVLLPLDFG
ncbi:MAG: hypothetical protein PVF34_02515 [Gammaproteobacteria bacterium]